MDKIVFPKSITKTKRVAPFSQSLGTIPNNGVKLGTTIAAVNKDASERVNFRVFARNIEAAAGGGKANATQLDTREFQVIEVVASNNDSVKLPKAIPNMIITVINRDNNPLDVFSLGTDTLNASAILPVSIAGYGAMRVIAISGSEWVTY